MKKMETKRVESRLETKRLELREIQAGDVEEIFHCWMQDENVSRYMWWKASDDVKDAEEFVQFELENLENDQWNRLLLLFTQVSIIMCQKTKIKTIKVSEQR